MLIVEVIPLRSGGQRARMLLDGQKVNAVRLWVDQAEANLTVPGGDGDGRAEVRHAVSGASPEQTQALEGVVYEIRRTFMTGNTSFDLAPFLQNAAWQMQEAPAPTSDPRPELPHEA